MRYNIIYSVGGVTDDFRKTVAETVEKTDNEIGSHIVRIGRNGIAQSLAKYKRGDGVVLIIPTRFEHEHISIETLNSFRTSLVDLRIIVILNESDFKTTFVADLLSNGYTLGLLDQEAKPGKIAQLIVYGREYEDAKRYYGLSDNAKFKDNIKPFTFTTKEAGLAYMDKELGEGETYAKRLEWIKSNSEKNIYIDVIRELGSVVKEEIKQDPIYETVFSDGFGIADRLDEKNNVGLKKVVQTLEGEESSNIEIRMRREISTAVSRAVNRVWIGVAATGDCIGSTHQSILIANFLAKSGYRVAVIEDYRNARPALAYLGDAYGKRIDEAGCFRLERIDFYPEFNMNNITFLNPKNYQFYIFDFGKLKEDNLPEFRSCVKQMILNGSQAWNIGKLQEYFSFFEPKEREQLNYVFTFAPLQDRSNIKANMRPLKNVFFSKCYPDCFSDLEDSDMCYEIFKDYVAARDEEKPGLGERIRRFFS